MSEPFLSEIKIMSFIYAPRGWALCNGQFLPINQNQALFALLGTTYGGNGQTTFALPDLRARVPIHFGDGFNLGQVGGEQSHTLTQGEMPTHIHFLTATTRDADNLTAPSNTSLLGKSNPQSTFGPPANLGAMDPSSLSNTGGSQAHQNMQPFLTLSFCIALQGIFPSQN